VKYDFYDIESRHQNVTRENESRQQRLTRQLRTTRFALSITLIALAVSLMTLAAALPPVGKVATGALVGLGALLLVVGAWMLVERPQR